MKVVKHGNTRPLVNCKLCTCVFEYEPEDIIVDKDWEAAGDGDEIDLISCRDAFPDLAKRWGSVMILGWMWQRGAFVRCPECGHIEKLSASYAFDCGAQVIVSKSPLIITDKLYGDILEGKRCQFLGMEQALIKDITGDGEYKYGYLKMYQYCS